MESVAFRCDHALLPVVVVRWPSAWRDLDELRAALNQMSDSRRFGRIAYVVDVRGVRRPTSEERAVIATFMRERRRERGDNNLQGFALVSDSLTARGFLLALGWLVGGPCPMEAFADLDSAIAWAQTRAPA